MATGRAAAEGPKRLICAVCLERYKRPKLLSCFHTYCEGCLSSLAPPPSPSFLCPACRVTVTVPPGGVTKFQSNFYIEEDIAREESRDKKKCEVCTSGHVARHKCVDCQQFYCAPCLATHNTFTVNQSHKVLTLSAEETTVDEPKPCEKCKLHPDQVKALYCRPCAQSICLLCKLTSHEGHASEDVLAASTRVRQQLHDMVATVSRRVREMEVEEELARTIAENIQKEQTYAETELEKRKARLVEWAEQGCKDAVETARAITTARVDSLKMKLEKASAARDGLVAKADHINLSLARGNHSELLQLKNDLELETADYSQTQDAPGASEAATATKPLNDVDRESCTLTQSDGQTEGCSSEDRVPCLQLHWDDSALSHSSLLRYIGQVVSVESPCMMPLCSRIGTGAGMLASSVLSDTSENAASSPTSIEDESGPTAQVNKAMPLTSKMSSTAKHATALHQRTQSDTACGGPSIALESSLTRNFLEVEKRNSCSGAQENVAALVVPSALRYSENPSAEVLDICLTSSNKLWIRYKPCPSAGDMLVLFDSDGTRLGTWRENFPSARRCTSSTSVGDVLVFLNSRGNVTHGQMRQRNVNPGIESVTWAVQLDWFGPDGQHGSTDTPPANHILFSQNSQPLYGVLYDESSQEYNVHRLTISSFHPLSVTSEFILKSHLTTDYLHSSGVISDGAVANFDVSADGLFFAFSVGNFVTVYFKQEKTASLAIVCDATSAGFFLRNPFFCHVGDQELLAAGLGADNIVALSYHDGLMLKKETTCEAIGPKDKMSAGRHGVVYIGKPGGRINVVKLNEI